MQQNQFKSACTAGERTAEYIPALDGLRAVAVCAVVWYHLWQQSWLRHDLHLPEPLISLGLPPVLRLEQLTRTGYVFVELLLLLSAFCLFLPYARCMMQGGRWPDTRDFYKRRAARIIPSYYLCVLLIFFCYTLPTHACPDTRAAFSELFSTLTFTQILNPVFKASPHINGVLWTAAVEVQFYLIFPLLTRCFRKKPLLTWLGMVSLSMAYVFCYAMADESRLWFTLYRLPAYFGVFANGMLLALAYARLSAVSGQRLIRIAATASFFLGAVLLIRLQRDAAAGAAVTLWQAEHRFRLSLVFCMLLLGASLGARPLSAVLGCRLMRFLAAISYNLYIWHQWFFFRFKEWHIPFWEGETLPNMAYDLVWQRRYTVLMLAISLAAATVLSYCFERPAARKLLKR